jgi:hypothetical protein
MDTWPFDLDQYLLLNIAIQADIAPSFSSSAMEIDYVRVYQERSTAISEIQGDFISRIYPVPFDNHLNIDLNKAADQNTLLSIYTYDGRLIDTRNVEIINNSLVLHNLNNLSKGLYFVSFEINNKPFRVKVVKN